MEQVHEEVKKWIGKQRGYIRFWLNWHLSQKNEVSERIRDDINDDQRRAMSVVKLDSIVRIAEEARLKFTFITSITVYVKDIHVYAWPKKMEQMTELLRFLADKGIRQTKDSKEDTDDHSWTWYLDKIQLTAWFQSEEKNACKYVEDGVEEVKKYKMVCPGDPDYPTDD